MERIIKSSQIGEIKDKKIEKTFFEKFTKIDKQLAGLTKKKEAGYRLLVSGMK